MELVAHFQRLMAYEAACTPLIADSLLEARRRVDAAGLAAIAAPLERAVAIFSHVQAARELWLSRVSDLAGFPSGGVFPIWPLEQTRAKAVEMDELWRVFAARQTAASLAAHVRYTSVEGQGYESSLADIMTHVVNHSSYHRGQIAHLVAHTGTTPAVTDYIALTRAAL